MNSERQVFLNCPYDEGYRPLMWAPVFAVYDCGFTPRAALALPNAAQSRLSRILSLVRECPNSIHDLIYVNKTRFNMPFELGLAFGLAATDASRRVCVLTTDVKRLEKNCSDLKGIDPHVYGGDALSLVVEASKWLKSFHASECYPTATQIGARFQKFWSELPAFAQRKGFAVETPTWLEMTLAVHCYLRAYPVESEPLLWSTGTA